MIISGTRKYRTKKRSDRIVMTPAARLLKLLRNESGLSMINAAALIGVSDSYIAHIETGRMDVPSGEKLKRLVHVYGVRSTTYFERLSKFSEKPDPRVELGELLKRMRDKEVETVLAVARGLLS
ncbi:MAG: helix-turn-helix domain-containing protein [Pseudobdellovibrio sp.]|nr:helix-turn-helix domain-containing protein [Pseudobdellovibrio sp.]